MSNHQRMPSLSISPSVPAKAPLLAFSPLTDSHGRAITDLRISITDRCNYSCVYCRTGNKFMPLEEDRLWTPEKVVPFSEVVARLEQFREAARQFLRRNGSALYLRRRAGRDRRHCAGIASLLRAMQPHPVDFRRQDSHLPFFAVRPRPVRSHAARRRRRGAGGLHRKDRFSKGGAPPHR